tara:strand:+ start:2965 stop:3429 length:465 start_codon:yes stop_codon:yes gene_type:complete
MVYEKKEIDFKKLDKSNCQIIEKIQKDKYTINWNEDEIKNLFEKGGGEGIILINNSKPIGYCLFRILMDEVEILSIEIETKFRNMGLGLTLFNEIERSFEERKISKCFLEVNINNILARNFYEKIGFICIKNIKNYYKSDNSYQDGLLLQKTYI